MFLRYQLFTFFPCRVTERGRFCDPLSQSLVWQGSIGWHGPGTKSLVLSVYRRSIGRREVANESSNAIGLPSFSAYIASLE